VIQLSLLDQPRPRARARRTDPATSKIAAAKVTPKESSLRALVLGYLRTRPDGATSREIAEATGRDRVTISPRLAPMADEGLLERAPVTRDGSTVWRLLC
jgi:DNA-binding MarR family transcriptional regulator